VLTDSATLFEALTTSLAQRLAAWRRGAGFAAIRADWMARAAGMGGDMRARLPDREIVGRGEGLDAHGRLLLRLPDGSVQAIAAGDVFPMTGAA
jgi:BirA family transcriptional regulator, biotin operon repressor / biotin---[acetyl-CoA-carboxylase] ligase